MARTHYFYTQLPDYELENLLSLYQKEFDELLEDNFSEAELKGYEKKLEAMAAVEISEKLADLSFDDFFFEAQDEKVMKPFFESAQSVICLENLPFFETNCFQVSFLRGLLDKLEQVLIDQDGVEPICFKEGYLEYLSPFLGLESLMRKEEIPKVSGPVDTVDFLALDVYKEIYRLKAKGLIEQIESELSSRSEKQFKIFSIMKKYELEPFEIQKKSGLIPKDFGDGLESLKFYLKRL
ncbi:MAG: hypothetical protein K2P81_09610 [Bacteriovoracaceae bacterium]|nr:hypothetical protein [Bacteriovoracaceae bacterium]